VVSNKESSRGVLGERWPNTAAEPYLRNSRLCGRRLTPPEIPRVVSRILSEDRGTEEDARDCDRTGCGAGSPGNTGTKPATNGETARLLRGLRPEGPCTGSLRQA